MTKISINKDKIKFSNLHKSFFSELKNTMCDVSGDQVTIYDSSKKNSDPACVELKIKDTLYEVYFWDKNLNVQSVAEPVQCNAYSVQCTSEFCKKFARSVQRVAELFPN